MNGIFFLLLVLSFISLVIGLIKPCWILRWGEVKSRKRVLIIFGSISIIFFALTIAFSPSSISEQKQQTTSEKIVQSEGGKISKLKASPEKIIAYYTQKGFTSQESSGNTKEQKNVHLKSPDFNNLPVSITMHYVNEKSIDSIACEYDISISNDSKNTAVMKALTQAIKEVFDSNSESVWDEISANLKKGTQEKKSLYEFKFKTKDGINVSGIELFHPNGVKIILQFDVLK